MTAAQKHSPAVRAMIVEERERQWSYTMSASRFIEGQRGSQPSGWIGSLVLPAEAAAALACRARRLGLGQQPCACPFEKSRQGCGLPRIPDRGIGSVADLHVRCLLEQNCIIAALIGGNRLLRRQVLTVKLNSAALRKHGCTSIYSTTSSMNVPERLLSQRLRSGKVSQDRLRTST